MRNSAWCSTVRRGEVINGTSCLDVDCRTILWDQKLWRTIPRQEGTKIRFIRLFMRATVLVSDLFIYGTAVWAWSRRLTSKSSHILFAFAIMQPAIVLIDHGHFQYNTVALGLSLWSFYYMTLSWKHCIVASILFCLALSFKQMTLYYAPAVFFFLLGRCFETRTF